MTLEDVMKCGSSRHWLPDIQKGHQRHVGMVSVNEALGGKVQGSTDPLSLVTSVVRFFMK